MRDKRPPVVAALSAAPADSDESPKNTKRDGKPATERPVLEDLELLSRSHQDRGRRRRLQDPLPLEEASGTPNAVQPGSVMPKDVADEGAPARIINPTYVPRSGYYFQHDDRTAPMAGRNRRRSFDNNGPSEARHKTRYNDRFRERSPEQQSHKRHGTSPVGKSDDAWTHDKFYESQVAEHQSKRRRVMDEHQEGKEPTVGGDRKAERRIPEREHYHGSGVVIERHYHGSGVVIERGRWMDGRYQAQDGGYGRFGGGRERLGMRRNSGRNLEPVERWTHDRFEENNRSPSPQKEDSIAQIEALLAA